ncbi:MAG: tRNA (adenosine(37)-N6)-threonylcarbamoyltransferase complex dimerization subunit type 1 TsaB [Limnohabitans sp.]|nr:tRNA (adenosine(37)-N6)-threonylcarbamoyltransferase complex dimerization subunit type 1 TsaB [Limnohabitans sp.]
MNILAIDTGTERMSLAVCHGDQLYTHDGLAGAQASLHLLPAVLGLLTQSRLSLSDLQAIAFGCGPGAFTGLRTACSVAQGLALGAQLPLLPIDSLLCIAETARTQSPRVLALLDARMEQVYACAYEWQDNRWHTHGRTVLTRPDRLALPPHWAGQPFALAGNAMAAHSGGLQQLLSGACQAIEVWPQARAMLTLAAQAWAGGDAVAAADALPVYVRDDVARTTAQRTADKLAGA